MPTEQEEAIKFADDIINLLESRAPDGQVLNGAIKAAIIAHLHELTKSNDPHHDKLPTWVVKALLLELINRIEAP